MPYIPEPNRDGIYACLKEASRDIKTTGELNYAITILCHLYLKNHAPVNYERLNEVDGALGCARSEYQRSVVGPYEEKKKTENGDIDIL
jgi:hypothetical protein